MDATSAINRLCVNGCFFFPLSFCFCSGFYRIQKVQIIY